jgi:uncharacterized protein YggE
MRLADEGAGISVTGQGSVSAAPDRADFTFGVETQGETAGEALAANGAAAAKVIEAVRVAGVAAEDVQRQEVAVHSRYASEGQAIVGFTATNTVTAALRDLDKAATVIEAAVAGGANAIHGPTFVVSQRAGLYGAALESAFVDARAKAELLAGVTGVTLGEVVTVVEGGPPAAPRLARLSAEVAAGPPLEPGLQEIQASLMVTFAIGRKRW